MLDFDELYKKDLIQQIITLKEYVLKDNNREKLERRSEWRMWVINTKKYAGAVLLNHLINLIHEKKIDEAYNELVMYKLKGS